MMRRLVVGGTLVMLACGVPLPWEMKGVPKPPPDIQYRTGTEVGDDIYVWYCLNNERIVVIQGTSAMCGASPPRMMKGPCGTRLAWEDARYDDGGATSHPVPTGLRWPGSPPPPPEPAEPHD